MVSVRVFARVAFLTVIMQIQPVFGQSGGGGGGGCGGGGGGGGGVDLRSLAGRGCLVGRPIRSVLGRVGDRARSCSRSATQAIFQAQ